MSKAINDSQVHHVGKTNRVEIYLRLATGIFLWIISTSLTIGLFPALASDYMIRQVVMIGTAIGLESAKLLSFRMEMDSG